MHQLANHRGWSIGETLRCCRCCKLANGEVESTSVTNQPDPPPVPLTLFLAHRVGKRISAYHATAAACHCHLPCHQEIFPQVSSKDPDLQLLHSDDSLLPKVMASSCVGTSVSKRKLDAAQHRLEILIICRIENLLMRLVWSPLSVEWC